MNIVKMTVAVLAVVASFSAFAGNRPGIISVLPVGPSTASVLGVAADPKAEEISGRFSAAAQANSEWFKGYVAAHSNLKPGVILPYHKNLGISEDEYRFFIESSQKSTRIVEVGKISISTKTSGNITQIDIGDKNSVFKSVRVDINNGVVYTALGEISNPKYVEPTQEGALIGKWSGYVWRREEGDPRVPTGEAKTISITFGVIKESGKKYIQYKAKVMKQGEMVLAEDINLFVDDVHNNSLEGRRP